MGAAHVNAAPSEERTASLHHLTSQCALVATCLLALANTCIAANEPVMKRGESRDWVLYVKVEGQSTPLRRYLNNGVTPGFNVSTAFEINSAVFVYPVLESSAGHESHPEKATSTLSVDDKVYDSDFVLLPDYQAGEQLGRWELPALRGILMRFLLDLPMTCYDVTFDEKRAMQIRWPKNPWPPIAASALQPQLFIESDDPYIEDLVAKWTNNNPGAVPPARLAKYLAARVMDGFRITTDANYISGHGGEIAGININGASIAARSAQGTPADLTALLCAVYRAAGIPARYVIGYDLAASLGMQLGIPDIDPVCEHNARDDDGIVQPVVRTWLEFYLFDEANQRGEWIPVDIAAQFKITSRPPRLEQPWDFFGNNPCLKHLAPISFHLHPPTTVVNSGPPALWGWLPLPAAPSLDQRLDFGAREETVRGGDRD